ncbi:alcohol dehydrogenase catalytic domain-containing protein (plasmid) [Rhodococcus sp. USK10]|uniref:alcohol dehydrogenase catalytic domain-containing protein n=1 Tax=Rhodococcus sp. USK10 TaxID=2789739 RepID=UPI001C5F43D8|nr:alcohol dehydrogenase catalytic domain-containing protein [Rhodococcus sp. USK10]QYB00564.1 alcohol dehydrogenase catalytic domain-containing protein [Rhodococcus sp. USK10]
MKAARLHTFGAGFVIEEVPTPVPGPGQALIRIAGAGACHSDLHIASGETQGVALPHTLGHENARLGLWTRQFLPRRQRTDVRHVPG